MRLRHLPMPKKMDTFIVLTLLGAICTAVFSTSAAIVKYRNDKASSAAKKLEEETRHAEQLRLAAERYAETQRLAEVRQGEVRELLATRDEMAALRRQLLAQSPVPPDQTPKAASSQKAIEGLDKVIEKALRDVSAETAAEIRRLGQQDAQHAIDVARAAENNQRLLPVVRHIVDVITQTIRASSSRGLVTLEKESPPNEISVAMAPHEKGGGKVVNFYEADLAGGMKILLRYQSGFTAKATAGGIFRKGKPGELATYGPHFFISYSKGNALSGHRIIALADIDAERGLSLKSELHAPSTSFLPATSERLKKAETDYRTEKISGDEFISTVVTEMIKEMVVRASTGVQ